MKRFAFQFEKLLRVREFAENAAKEELGRQIGALNGIEARIAENETRRTGAAEKRFAKGNSIPDMDAYNFYIMRLDHEKTKLLEDAEEQNKKVEEARAQYIEASREKKIIEKLKEKERKEYKRETQKSEEEEIDTLSGQKHREPRPGP
ncbi:MAG: flagellar export protein FliJ [Spirochaetaceae bacterium]|jgi:flagellar FliJ protein|nr:flagellar export protein FliJ [Spirochaetaceae bacterium]